jgi:hypothetical protein
LASSVIVGSLPGRGRSSSAPAFGHGALDAAIGKGCARVLSPLGMEYAIKAI